MLVVQAMVDSVGEKERLLRRSQQNLTEDAKTQLAEMDTLMADNSRLKRLVREKEGEFSSLSARCGTGGGPRKAQTIESVDR